SQLVRRAEPAVTDVVCGPPRDEPHDCEPLVSVETRVSEHRRVRGEVLRVQVSELVITGVAFMSPPDGLEIALRYVNTGGERICQQVRNRGVLGVIEDVGGHAEEIP